MPDETVDSWYNDVEDGDVALATARSYFEDGGAGALFGMTGLPRDPENIGQPLAPEEIPEEGIYLIEVILDAARAQG